MLLLLRFTFLRFSQNPKKRDFLRLFLLCCIRFLELWCTTAVISSCLHCLIPDCFCDRPAIATSLYEEERLAKESSITLLGVLCCCTP